MSYSFVSYTMRLILIWFKILDVSSQKAIKFSVQQVYSGKRRIISKTKYPSRSEKVVGGRSELDSQSDTTVEGDNYSIMEYTGNSVMYHHIVTNIKLSNEYQ